MSHFTYTVKIYVPDTDYGGVVYHANYLKFMDQARTEWLTHVGFPLRYFAEQNTHFVIRSVEIEYLRPAMLEDVIAVDCAIARVGKSSIDFNHVIKNANDHTRIYCRAMVKLVCVNNELKPITVPQVIIDKLV